MQAKPRESKHPVAKGLMGVEAAQVVQGDVDNVPHGLGQVVTAANVGGEHQIGAVPEGVIAGERLRLGDVQRRAPELPGFQLGLSSPYIRCFSSGHWEKSCYYYFFFL